MARFCPPGLIRTPTENSGIAVPALLHAPRTVTVPSGSYRDTVVRSVLGSRPASAATAANTFSGGAPLATRVATRRSAASSSA